MKQRRILILILAISVSLIAGLIWFNVNKEENREEKISSLFVDDSEHITSSRKESSLWLNEIYVDDMRLIYDEDQKVFFASIRNTDEVKDLALSWNSRKTNIALINKEINDELLFNNDGIDLLVYDKNRYFSGKLKFTTLPIINICKFANNVHSNYDDCIFEIADASEGSLYAQYDGRVRIRGASTGSLDKPGMRLKFDSVLKGDNNTEQKYYDLFGLYPDNEFVLYTANVEKNNIRNVFSSNLWYETCSKDNQFSTDTGIYFRYVEVFINDKYWGLGAIGNSINKRMFAVDTKSDSNKYPYENIYKANFYGHREYLDIKEYDTYSVFDQNTNKGNMEAWKPLEDFMKLLLYSKDSEALYESVDLDNTLDIYLFLNLIQGWDNAYFDGDTKFRNLYLISKYNDADELKFMYGPWDLDRTWGREVEEDDNYTMDPTHNFEMIVTPVENLLNMGDPKIKGLIFAKYEQLRYDLWSDDNLMRMLVEYEKQIYGSGAYQRDRERWPENPHVAENDLKEFKEYVLKRMAYFDEYIKEQFS